MLFSQKKGHNSMQKICILMSYKLQIGGCIGSKKGKVHISQTYFNVLSITCRAFANHYHLPDFKV